MKRKIALMPMAFSGLLAIATSIAADPVPEVPESHRDLTAPISMAQFEGLLQKWKGTPTLSVTVEGQSVEGRPLHLLHFKREASEPTYRIFYIGVQHGNEPAGKDALVYMAKQLVANPEMLPEDVELFILPFANPDGSEAYKRTNANGKDLNRDHIVLSQPETQTIHRIHRRIDPHLTVDCHEFGRDTGDYWDRGYTEWPLIMMDTISHPLYHPGIMKAGIRWINETGELLNSQGLNFERYFVGSIPPGEQRHSHPELTDCRNGCGAYGAFSFIIESGVYRRAENQHADLAERVTAYLAILWNFIETNKYRETDLALIAESKKSKVPPFLPTNYFWANLGLKIREFPVIDRVTKETVLLQSGSFYDDLVVKTTVPTPMGYLVTGSHVALYRELAERHELVTNSVETPTVYTVEQVYLERMEREDDPVYGRYGGRAITRREKPSEVTAAVGSMYIPINQPNWRKVAIYFEPTQMYGLYEAEEFEQTIGEEGLIPVHRVVESGK